MFIELFPIGVCRLKPAELPKITFVILKRKTF